MSRNEKIYNKIVGVKNNELYVCEYTFDETENFRGATGWHMEIITKDYIEERNSIDYAENEEDIWKDCVANGNTRLGLEEWWEELVDTCGINDELFPFDDSSFRYPTEELYNSLPKKDKKKIEEVLGVLGEDYETFMVSGCGRCFEDDTDDDWQVIIDHELLDEIRKHERKGVQEC